MASAAQNASPAPFLANSDFQINSRTVHLDLPHPRSRSVRWGSILLELSLRSLILFSNEILIRACSGLSRNQSPQADVV